MTTDSEKLQKRVHILPENELVAQDPKGQRKRLREQLEIYSMQFKIPDTVFQKGTQNARV
jgi:hypothetical protein